MTIAIIVDQTGIARGRGIGTRRGTGSNVFATECLDWDSARLPFSSVYLSLYV